MGNDPLREGAAIAFQHHKLRSLGAKTRHNHLMEVNRFVEALRGIGYEVKKWRNLSNKHVAAVVKYWRNERLLTPKTIKEYLSGVRMVSEFFGNNRISLENSAFGIPNIQYITNRDKALPEDVFEKAVNILLNDDGKYDGRIAAMLQLERGLGLRTEEAAKFNPGESLLPNGDVYICRGTKGGRERTIESPPEKGLQAVEITAAAIGRDKNLIPKTADMTEQKWRNIYYRRMGQIGITKKEAGASGHGNRHAYAQERYQSLTGFVCPCKFSTIEEFSDAAQRVDAQWQKSDKVARLRLKAEMGHGPDRDQVVSQYIGSCSFTK